MLYEMLSMAGLFPAGPTAADAVAMTGNSMRPALA